MQQANISPLVSEEGERQANSYGKAMVPLRNAIWVHAALDDLGLAASQFRVYAHLARRAGRGLAWPSIDSIAEVCHLCRRTVIAALAELEGRGLIRAERRPGRSTRYRLADLFEWAEENSKERGAEAAPSSGDPCTPPILPTGGSAFCPLELYPISTSQELNPLNRSREGVRAEPSAGTENKPTPFAASSRKRREPSETQKFWVLTKQIDCNAELMKALEKRGMRDDNDRLIFSKADDRDEYRRLRAERKALLEQTRPRMDSPSSARGQ